MVEDMIQIKIAVEGMKAQIITAFDAEKISADIKKATEKAVDEFDMDNFIKRTTEDIFDQSREIAIIELSGKYGSRWADDLSKIIDDKIEQALKGE